MTQPNAKIGGDFVSAHDFSGREGNFPSASTQKRFSFRESAPTADQFTAKVTGLIKNGHHPLDIWQIALGLETSDMMVALGLPDEDAHKRMLYAPDGPYSQLRGQHILNFCRWVKMHPAELVPLVPDPALALPHAILEANLMILDDRTSSRREIQMAKKAIRYERERFRVLGNNDGAYQVEYEHLSRVVKERMTRNVLGHLPEELSGTATKWEALTIVQLERMLENLETERRLTDERLTVAVEANRAAHQKFFPFMRGAFIDLEREYYRQLMDEIHEREGQWTKDTLSAFLYRKMFRESEVAVTQDVEDTFRSFGVRPIRLSEAFCFEETGRQYEIWRDSRRLMQGYEEKLENIAAAITEISYVIQTLGCSRGQHLLRLVANQMASDEWQSQKSNEIEDPHMYLRRWEIR